MAAILLIAPTIDKDDVGEAWVAFQWASLLSARHEVTVLTYRKRGHPPITSQLPRARVVEWVEPPLVGRAERVNSLLKPGYFTFYRQARSWLARARRSGAAFDVGFQPVPVAMRYPSPLAGSGIPYVLGPVGGSLASPAGFVQEEGGSPWYLRLRAIDALRLRHDPWLRRSFDEASCVLGIGPYVGEALSERRLSRFEVMSETGLDALPAAVDRRDRGDPVRLLFVGRLVRTKGARDLVRAMALLRDLPVHLDVVGDGFDRKACQQLTSELGLESRITFLGRVPRVDIDAYYRAADVFVFPSYREPGGNVVFEAMGHGLPLVVCDRGGPAGAVAGGGCAVTVPAVTPDQLATDVAAAVAALVHDPERRRRLGVAAREHVARTGLWECRVQQLETVFSDLMARPVRTAAADAPN